MTSPEATSVSRHGLLRTSTGGAACLATAGAAGAASAQDGDNATDGGNGGGESATDDGNDGGENATDGTDSGGASADQPASESAANQWATYIRIGMLALGFLSPIVFALLVRGWMTRGS